VLKERLTTFPDGLRLDLLKMTCQKQLSCAAIILWAAVTSGGVFLVPERNALWITDYPPGMPCSLSQLAEVDRAFGWGRVSYDRVTSTCTVTGDLIIGANDGSQTVLKIGSAERPDETLVMKGNLYIHPYFVAGRNKGLYWRAPRRKNAVVVGDREDKTVKASLKFACSPEARFTLRCGRMPWIETGALQHGGGLYVYNSRVAPLSPAPGCEIGDGLEGVYLEGSTVLDNAKITGVKGMLYRMAPGVNRDCVVKDTTFERVGAPIAGGVRAASGCRFINCGTAVLDRGSLDLELSDCVFKGNELNWALTYSDKGLVCIDCRWETPGKANRYRIWTDKTGKRRRPKFANRRHVVVEVLDAAGKPVAGATVSFRSEQEGCGLLQNRTYKTGKDGRTPGEGQDGALQLTEYVKTATDVPDEPDVKFFTYAITAESRGKRTTVQNVAPARSWETISLTLK